MSVPVLSWLFVAKGATEAFWTGPLMARKGPPSPRKARADRWQPPVSQSRPLDPTLRANPFPEVTDPFCRLPLSTLFYRLEAVHLGDLMRLWVRPGKISNCSPRFSRAVGGAPDTARSAVLYQLLGPISGWADSRAFELLKRKENSPQGHRRRLRARLRCRQLPCPGKGILTLSPFDGRAQWAPWYRFAPSLRID